MVFWRPELFGQLAVFFLSCAVVAGVFVRIPHKRVNSFMFRQRQRL